jgi:DNA-binding beta-propeller fold protein YncE
MKTTFAVAILMFALVPTIAAGQLPTGARLDPAGTMHDLGSLPLAMTLSPDRRQLVVLLNGWREQGLQIFDIASGSVTQTLKLPAVFLGLAFAPDGKSLYVSGGNGDLVYRCDWTAGRATLADSVLLGPRPGRGGGKRYPAGIAISADGKTLYAAENLSDSLTVVELGSGAILQRFSTERYPNAVVRAPDGTVYVSAWGGWTVSVFKPAGDGKVRDAGRIRVPRHPSALLLNRDGSRLFVASGSTDRIAVIDTKSRRQIALLMDPPTGAVGEGSTPNALALSDDGTRLFVAEADDNAVAVFDLSAATAGVAGAHGSNALTGRIPAGWYPSAVGVVGSQLAIVSAKGRGAGSNRELEQPDKRRADQSNQYTLGQLSGTLSFVPLSDLRQRRLSAFTARVAVANGWGKARAMRRYPPFEHVVYIIKENRTYDQVFGDLAQADGDTSLLFFPRNVSPNHHALAERFGIFDRFFVNAEVSPDGHEWSTAAYVTDYSEKTISSNYSGRGRSYDYEGTNRNAATDDDVAGPASGYLWDLAERAGISYRNYGEFVVGTDFEPGGTKPAAYDATKPALQRHTNHDYPGFSLSIPDQRRADIWIEDLAGFSRSGEMPKLEIVRLPNDHTAGMRAGDKTPRAFFADNDLALGRMIEALSRSPFWKNTVVFVLEDDAQAGPDHVSSHRSPMLTISAYNRGGVFHRFANTTDVIATIEGVLGLGNLSQFDHYGRPLAEIWSAVPNLSPYVALTPSTPLDERNPKSGALAEASKKLALSKEDEADEQLFNRILWEAIKGNKNYPGPKRVSSLDLQRGK